MSAYQTAFRVCGPLAQAAAEMMRCYWDGRPGGYPSPFPWPDPTRVTSDGAPALYVQTPYFGDFTLDIVSVGSACDPADSVDAVTLAAYPGISRVSVDGDLLTMGSRYDYWKNVYIPQKKTILELVFGGTVADATIADLTDTYGWGVQALAVHVLQQGAAYAVVMDLYTQARFDDWVDSGLDGSANLVTTLPQVATPPAIDTAAILAVLTQIANKETNLSINQNAAAFSIEGQVVTET